jgi:hypothetical protein
MTSTTTTTTPQAAPAGTAGNDLPSFAFERPNWTPGHLPRNTMIPARELCDLVDYVKDVAAGAATVFELIACQEREINDSGSAYLSPYHLGQLSRMAARSLDSLDDKASEIATRLHDLARGEA